MAGQEGLEPPAAGFGVRSSTIRATGLYPENAKHKKQNKTTDCNGFHFCDFIFVFSLRLCLLVHRMLTAEPAVLVQVQFVRSISLVLGR